MTSSRSRSESADHGDIRVRDEILAEIMQLLYGFNYQVSLYLYRMPFAPNSTVEEYVTRALGPDAVIGNFLPVTGEEILTEVEQSLLHQGDGGYGPDQAKVQSSRFRQLMTEFLQELKTWIESSVSLSSFWLKDGHPAYPVWWDFAYFVAGPEVVFVLIGSSSD